MHPVQTFEIVLVLFGISIGLHWLAERTTLPPSAALLIGGGALALAPGLPTFRLDPELILVLFLPPLLLDGAFHTAFGRFRRYLPGIMSMAIGAVIFTTLVVGLLTHLLLPNLPWAACFALGAIVSPPDAIAARAVLQRISLPRRLQALLEGESLLNDATGLILFRFAVAATLTGTFDAGAAIGGFAALAVGGAAVGAAVGFLWMFVPKRLADDMLVVAAASLLCWAAYMAGEALHVSGVIATVTAGIVFGWYQHEILPASVRLHGSAFWRTLVFALDAMIFILMGFSLREVLERVGGLEALLGTLALPALAVTGGVIAARFLWVFGVEALLSVLSRSGVTHARSLGWRQATVLSWTGMRGVVTLAVALALPEAMPGRDLMLVAAFVVILVTVILQGTSLNALLRLVQPVDVDPPAAMALPAAEASVARAKLAAADELAHTADGRLIHPQLLEAYHSRSVGTERFADDAHAFMAQIRPHFDLMLRVVEAGRSELLRLHRAGQIEDEVLHNLERDLDIEEIGIIFHRGDDLDGAELTGNGTDEDQPMFQPLLERSVLAAVRPDARRPC